LPKAQVKGRYTFAISPTLVYAATQSNPLLISAEAKWYLYTFLFPSNLV